MYFAGLVDEFGQNPRTRDAQIILQTLEKYEVRGEWQLAMHGDDADPADEALYKRGYKKFLNDNGELSPGLIAQVQMFMLSLRWQFGVFFSLHWGVRADHDHSDKNS